jgi:eukaryotic-like serine/threonine-protein kinase
MTDTSPATLLVHPRFSVQRHLGAGAFGEVYQVYDQERHMVVALKALREVSPETIYRFKQEFRSLADITHRNLVTLYELMADGERWFFTMELVDGVNFLDYARGGSSALLVDSLGNSPALADAAALPTIAAHRVVAQERDGEPGIASDSDLLRPQSVTRVVSGSGSTAAMPPPPDMDRLLTSLGQLAEGLGALHEADKLHCDIKPSNVLVTSEKRVVLLDFGLVTELSDPHDLFQSMAVAGTPAYMSPEQAAGQPLAASDWYAVGVMLYQALTGALPFTGQLLDVLSNKQHFEAREAREIAADVPEHLNALCRDLLRRDPHARPSAAEVLRRLGQARNQVQAQRATLRTSTRVAPLVGREEHLAALLQAYSTTKQQARAVTVLVTGNSGMGKSALVRRFLADLPQRDSDAVILVGRCYESESVPYKALDMLIDALSRYLKSLPNGEAEALMPRDVMALARLFPVLRQVGAVARSRRRVLEIPDSQEIRRRAFAALRELLARLADRRPLILFIDDLQWGDVDSGMLLGEILRPPDAPAFLLIASYRSEDAHSAAFLSTFLPSLHGTVETHELAVGELSASDARQLALALLLEPGRVTAAHVEAIMREARGSPFFVHELSRHSQAASLESAAEQGATDAKEKLPAATLDEVIWARVLRLPVATRRLLEVVAVSGQPLALAVARQAVRLDGEEQQALATLRTGRLLRTRATAASVELETYHDRVRETVVAHLAAAQLREHHHQLAQVLEATGTADPETLTVHFKEGGDLGRAAGHAAAAAAQAAEALAFERAARLYQRALDLQPGADDQTRLLRIKLGDALMNAGRGAEAARAYLAALVGATAAESLELQRRAAEQLLRSGHIDAGLQVIRTVLLACGMHLPSTPQRALLSLLWQRLRTPRGWKFHECTAAQVPGEDLSRIDTCWSAALGLVMVDAMRAADFQSRNLRLSLLAGEPVRIVRALSLEACFYSAAGNRGRRRTTKLLAAATSLAERVNHPEASGSAALAAGTAAWFHGQYRRCLELTQRAEAIYREQCRGVSWELYTAQHFSLRSLLYLGELPLLLQRLPRLLKEAQERGDLYAETNLRTRIAYFARLCSDEPTLAREELSRAIGRWSQQAFHSQHYYELVGQVDIALYATDVDAAWQQLAARWPAMERSLILRSRPTRIEALQVRARTSLAAAASQHVTRSTVLPAPQLLLRQAASDARYIARQRAAWSDPLAHLIEAGIAAARGDQPGSLALLERAERGFSQADMGLYEAVTRRRRGQLIGGEQGRTLLEVADRWMMQRQVNQPERWAAMLAPGAW